MQMLVHMWCSRQCDGGVRKQGRQRRGGSMEGYMGIKWDRKCMEKVVGGFGVSTGVEFCVKSLAVCGVV